MSTFRSAYTNASTVISFPDRQTDYVDALLEEINAAEERSV